jgi:hypothetical protein
MMVGFISRGIGLLIALILMIIATVVEAFHWICADRSKIGGADRRSVARVGGRSGGRSGVTKIENDDPASISSMHRIIAALTDRASPAFREKFTEKFTQIYTKRDLPPVVSIDDISETMPYDGRVDIFRTAYHIGQRKLFLSEVSFLAENVPEGVSAVCVYAGAAPSNHTGYLSELFPGVKFILVDPNPFDVREANPVFLRRSDGPVVTQDLAREYIATALAGDARIYIINDLFTLDISKALAELVPHDDLFFISDIRTNVSGGEAPPDTTDILWNLSQQYNWMCAMKPKMSMLKFRHPFYNESAEIFERQCQESPYKEDFDLSRANGIDFVANGKERRLIYWAGSVRIQAFPGRSSTETRLITPGTDLFDYGTPQAYEDKLFYYNTVERCYGRHKNANANRELGFDYCGDCALENYIWEQYVAAYPTTSANRDIAGLVKKLSQITYRDLKNRNHGYLFEPLPLAPLLDAIMRHNNNPRVTQLLFPQDGKSTANRMGTKRTTDYARGHSRRGDRSERSSAHESAGSRGGEEW